MLRIRSATIDDVPLLREMIVEFATFERLIQYVTVTEESLRRDGFGPAPRFHTLLPEWDGRLAGYVIYFPFFSSFQGPGLFLEDIYVREEFRGKGIGKLLMAEVAATTLREGLCSMRWEVLDWNKPAIGFYKKLGAELFDDWKEMILDGNALRQLASGAAR